jgi:hypothetical protein
MSYIDKNTLNFIDINTLKKKKPMYLHSPPENSVFGSLYTGQIYSTSNIFPNENNLQSSYKINLKYQQQNYKKNQITKNDEAYRKIWKAIHYIAIFYKPFPGEEKLTKEAFITFIMCVAELLPDESYSRHVKDFIIKNPLDNLNSPIERFKWTYKLHSYINFFRFMKNLKSFLIHFKKGDIEKILYNYCNSLELNQYQRLNCIKYVNTQIEQISNDNSEILNQQDISIENISYEEALKMYTITDTNIITKNDWGPAIWMMIHFFAFNLQKKNTHIYLKFIISLTYLLPCEECKKHMRTNLKHIPLEITRNSDSQSVFDWSFRFHNAINIQTRKEEIKDKKSIENMYRDNILQNYEYI